MSDAAARAVVDHAAPGVGRLRERFFDAPGLGFHVVVTVAALALLYSASFPGVAFFTGEAATLALLAAAVVWALRAAGYVLRRRAPTTRRDARWLIVAPLGGVVVVALMFANLPLRTRWAISVEAFDRWVDRAPAETAATDIAHFDVPGHVGLYRIQGAYRQGDAVIFFESTGALFDNAGFAYLPSGPFPELASGSFESPRFQHLSGDWYTWTASW